MSEAARDQYKKFLKQLNNWIPQHLLSQPVPPYLKYKYPAPTKSTLLRIAIQLIKEPAFYTQVLHLMNKMNIPPPFEELENEFPMVKEAYCMENYQDIFEITKVIESEGEESELEADHENTNPLEQIIPQKRKKRQMKNRIKIPKFINPLQQPVLISTCQKTVKPEEVFETSSRLGRGNIELKIDKLPELIHKYPEPAASLETTDSGFGLMFPVNKETEDENKDKEFDKNEFITSEQLSSNKISSQDQRILPVFKDYHPGKPSYKLYIKNLAKQVTENDLHFIFKRYILPSATKSGEEYNVRLMQEGRMKGQAFVTLQNIGQAQLALDETNGYILKDKPMVVQFAKVR